MPSLVVVLFCVLLAIGVLAGAYRLYRRIFEDGAEHQREVYSQAEPGRTLALIRADIQALRDEVAHLRRPEPVLRPVSMPSPMPALSAEVASRLACVERNLKHNTDYVLSLRERLDAVANELGESIVKTASDLHDSTPVYGLSRPQVLVGQ